MQHDTFDPIAWAEQPLIWTERVRGRGLYWPAAGDWFVNDPLGHAPHSHPDASEIFFVAHGRASIIVGRTEVALEPGDLLFIPRNGYHDTFTNHGTDLCIFVLVAPNWRGRRWQTGAFAESSYDVEPTVAPTDGQSSLLPGDDVLRSVVRVLAPGASVQGGESRSEITIYVLEGEIQLEVDRLHGALRPHEYAHVLSGSKWRITNGPEAPARFLAFTSSDPADAPDPIAEVVVVGD